MRQFIITEINGVWSIQESTLQSILPATFKTSEYEVISRLSQLLGIKIPVIPQTNPERVGVEGV